MNLNIQKQIHQKRWRRVGIIAACGCVLAIAVFLLMQANSESLVFFKTPTEIQAQPELKSKALRLGGQVKIGTYRFDNKGVYFFSVTDGLNDLPVEYHGLMPDLFREGQGVVAEGQINLQGVFIAKRVLAKHDETYKPPKTEQGIKP